MQKQMDGVRRSYHPHTQPIRVEEGPRLDLEVRRPEGDLFAVHVRWPGDSRACAHRQAQGRVLDELAHVDDRHVLVGEPEGG